MIAWGNLVMVISGALIGWALTFLFLGSELGRANTTVSRLEQELRWAEQWRAAQARKIARLQELRRATPDVADQLERE